MNEDEISIANNLYDKGRISELNALLEPFIEEGDPYAYYFCSRYSLPEWEESEEAFNIRHLDMLLKSAKADVAPAMYQLSSMYFSGEMVPVDTNLGRRYLDGALELGYDFAKVTVVLICVSGRTDTLKISKKHWHYC